MKAIVQAHYGSEDSLELGEVDRPPIGDDEVLVRVHAASVHVGDWMLMTGVPKFMRLATGLRRPRNRVPGTDVAGTVEAVGKQVTTLRPGDEVFGWCTGGFAEYAHARENQFARKPANLTFEQAAAVGVSATTALQLLRDEGKIQPGQKVLINGASGGVGTFAVQLAKVFGAEVTGVCSTRNLEMARSIGADREFAQIAYYRGCLLFAAGKIDACLAEHEQASHTRAGPETPSGRLGRSAASATPSTARAGCARRWSTSLNARTSAGAWASVGSRRAAPT